jgi:16S rRNA (cytosine967-C5)-methyltransferase
VLYVQDQGSQLVARLAATPGLTLDACAAPGGKAMLMADLPKSRVIAAEASRRRLRSMATLCRRWGSTNVAFVRADGTKPPFREGFDAVLLDAPCSGLGTLGRHPDIRWRLRPEDLPRHAARQRSLLEALAPLVRRGGRIVYATCSLEDEETLAVVLEFLDRNGDFHRAGAPGWAEPFQGEDGFVRTQPEREPIDGFFAAVLARA